MCKTDKPIVFTTENLHDLRFYSRLAAPYDFSRVTRRKSPVKIPGYKSNLSYFNSLTAYYHKVYLNWCSRFIGKGKKKHH